VNIHRGDIYWVDFGPVKSGAPAKIRPFLIIQVEEISSTTIKTVIGAAITSNLAA
jgi:mRNA-degrading endonuclease toxin of MazEF toxin-antitoxin module